MGAAGHFLVKFRHGCVLLGLAVGPFAGDPRSPVIAAARQDRYQ